MNKLPKNYRARLANFHNSKLRELKYFLEIIVDSCNESLRRACTSEANTDPTGGPVIFSFSAFTNAIQTLKDVTEKLQPRTMPWRKIKECRHGEFIYLSRNATTHDGNPIISTWADGKYFVPNDIIRQLEKGEIIAIKPPEVDVRQFILEFTLDFSRLIQNTLRSFPFDEDLTISPFDIDELELAYTNPHAPQFVKRMFEEKRGEIIEHIKEAKLTPVEDALKLANAIASYCEAELAKTQK
jgi:hypothetical protein